MKKICLLLLMLCFCMTTAQNLHALFWIDTVVTSIGNNVKAAYDKAHYAIVEANWVKQLKATKDNYDQAKKYHDDVKRASEHRGGIAGYFKDEVKDNIDRQNKDAYWRAKSWWETPAGETNIEKFVKSGDEYLDNQLDFTEEIQKISLKRDRRLKDVADRASKSKLSQEEATALNKEMMLLQLEFLDSIDKLLQQNLRHTVQDTKRNWSLLRGEKLAEKAAADEMKKIYLSRSKKQRDGNMEKRIERILKEVPTK